MAETGMKFSRMAVLAAFVALFGFAGTGASGEVDAPVAFAGGNLFPGRAVKVSRDFGFDAADSTRFLQAALSSGAAMVVVDRQASDWVVTCLTGAPNQKVVFEKGVVVRAKPGEFKGRNDCLLKYNGCTNVVLSGYGATLRMERAAYDAPPYVKSEWRHALDIRGGRNIRIEGLTITESGGDGVYLAQFARGKGAPQSPENVVLKDVKCVRNYRQGLSVISVNGLLCDNCDFSETAGTPPESGIDFEPNRPREELQNIVVRNCRFENNKGRGFEFYLGNLNSHSAPVTARFENCVTRGNVNGFAYLQRRSKFNDLPEGGKVELSGCTFERSSHAGVQIIDKPAASAEIAFSNCRLVDCCTVSTNGPDVRILTRLWDTPPVSGVDFSGLEICQPFPRQKFSEQETDWTAPGVTVPRLAEIAKPYNGVDPLLSNARVVDPAPGEKYALQGVAPVGAGKFAFHVDRPRKVRLLAKLERRSKRPLIPSKVEIWMGCKKLKVRLPQVAEEPVELVFNVPAAGFHELHFDAGRHAFRILEADVPLAVVVKQRAMAFAASSGNVYFWTGAKQPFALFVGGDSYEKSAAKVFAPDGAEAWKCNPVTKWERFQPAAEDVKEGLWHVEIVRPKGMRRTVQIDVPGTSGYLFLSPDRYWR